jgi:hypothetical protein
MFDPRDDARDRAGREDGRARVYDERDRDDDPREGLMHDLDLPRGDERELVAVRDRVHELDGQDSRTLAAVGAFRVVPEHDLDIDHETIEHLHDEGLVEAVDLGDDERGLTLTREGRELLDSHSLDRDGELTQDFYAGVSREREVEHDSHLYATYRQEQARLDDVEELVFVVILPTIFDRCEAVPFELPVEERVDIRPRLARHVAIDTWRAEHLLEIPGIPQSVVGRGEQTLQVRKVPTAPRWMLPGADGVVGFFAHVLSFDLRLHAGRGERLALRRECPCRRPSA